MLKKNLIPIIIGLILLIIAFFTLGATSNTDSNSSDSSGCGCSGCCQGDDASTTSSCFLPDTLITMSDGSLKPIADIKVGDVVQSADENLKITSAKVLAIEAPLSPDYYIINLENKKQLKLTDEHPIYMKSENYLGWASINPQKTINKLKIQARQVNANDYLLDSNNNWIKITSIKHFNQKVQTYNIKSIQTTNTFYAEGFLVHNKVSDVNSNSNSDTTSTSEI